MTPEERTLLSDLFTHLREVENQPRDPEAERFIQQMIQGQPAAAYYMAQSVLVQQQALTAAQQRIEDLERQVKEAQSRAQQTQAQPSGGSFLSNALGLGRSPWAGGGNRSAEPPAPSPQSPQGPAYNPMQPPGAPSRSPWGAAPQAGGQPGYGQPAYPPQPGYAPQPGFGPQGYAPRGGGFLSGAAQTAAGVAGGMLAASAISSMLSHSPGPFGEAAAAAGQTASHGETIINNYYGDSADQGTNQGGADQGFPPEDNNLQNVDYQTDDSSFDDGGDDSWI
ncbi:DUF2076 domain-containing protein [Azospirillum argentinense]